MEIEYKGILSRKHRFTDSMCLKNILYVLALESGDGIIRREQVNETLAKQDGLRAILALNGLSMSTLVKIIHLARICEDEALRDTLRFRDWDIETVEDTQDVWEAGEVVSLIMDNAAFRGGVINLFFEGVSLPVLHNHFPLREMTKLSSMRLSFKPHVLIETLVEYGLYYEQVQEVSEMLGTLSEQLEN